MVLEDDWVGATRRPSTMPSWTPPMWSMSGHFSQESAMNHVGVLSYTLLIVHFVMLTMTWKDKREHVKTAGMDAAT